MNDMMKWLSPSIENKTLELVNTLEQNESFKAFMDKLQADDTLCKDIAIELENLFILASRSLVESSYQTGFADCLALKK